MATTRLCSIPDCDKTIYAKALCRSHYERQRVHGDPMKGRPGTSKGAAIRFIRVVALSYEGEKCLIWPYSKDRNGYGQIRIDGQLLFVHRLVCEAVSGVAPTPMHEACHSCANGNLGCVTKGHLSWKTHAENMHDMIAHGTISRGTHRPFAKLTETEVREIRSLQNKITQEKLAQRFGVSRSRISAIQIRTSWAWVD
jgi:hypothetical protein